jgi:hypothetical protein
VTVSESLNELNSVSNMPVIPSNVVNELAVPSSPTIPGKPLKALAFFLDSFLETARSAAQRQASTVSQHGSVNHKEQRRSTLTRENLEQIALDVPDANPKKYTTVPILQPISSMKSFVPSSIRNVHSSSDQVRLMLSRSSVLPPPLYPEVKPIPSHIGNAALSPHLLTTSPISSLTNTPLESLLPQKDDDSRSSIRKNSKQRTFSPLAHSSMQNARIKVGMGRKMSRPVFDLPSGQDILKTLQPQPYQILLPTPHRYRFLSNDLDLDDLEMDPLTSPIDLFAGFGYSLSPAVS